MAFEEVSGSWCCLLPLQRPLDLRLKPRKKVGVYFVPGLYSTTLNSNWPFWIEKPLGVLKGWGASKRKSEFFSPPLKFMRRQGKIDELRFHPSRPKKPAVDVRRQMLRWNSAKLSLVWGRNFMWLLSHRGQDLCRGFRILQPRSRGLSRFVLLLCNLDGNLVLLSYHVKKMEKKNSSGPLRMIRKVSGFLWFQGMFKV